MKNLSEIDCWIFDLDNTLYPASVNLFGQINIKMSNYIMKLLNVDQATAEKMRAEYWEKYGTSLAGLMQNYEIDPNDFLKVVHDIDFSVKEAYKIALIEKDMGIKANYFFMLSSNTYNPLSNENRSYIERISNLGHEISLHFDRFEFIFR